MKIIKIDRMYKRLKNHHPRSIQFKTIAKIIRLLILKGSILTLFVSCASKPDWNQRHYQNSNKGAEANQLCNTGQINQALKLGYKCINNKTGREMIQNRAISSSNGNVNTIYINSAKSSHKPNTTRMYDVFKSVYEQERNDRLNRICTYNGTCK